MIILVAQLPVGALINCPGSSAEYSGSLSRHKIAIGSEFCPGKMPTQLKWIRGFWGNHLMRVGLVQINGTY